jgi:pyruvate formate lyase activating enzyme
MSVNKNKLLGYVHSIESLGALDGPGLRSVVFFQGCPLRCKFCHNIDCAQLKGGVSYTEADLVDELLKFKPYWGKEGGVTLSGGEPLYQCRFVYSITKALHEKDVHIAIDTSLYTSSTCLDLLIPTVNLWMVSIKELDAKRHQDLTGKDNAKILRNLRYLDDHVLSSEKCIPNGFQDLARRKRSRAAECTPCYMSSETSLQQRKILKGEGYIRIRVLIIPTLTDTKEYLEKLADIVLSLKHLEKVELLAYDNHARFKWMELKKSYAFDHIPQASKHDLEKAATILQKTGLQVMY